MCRRFSSCVLAIAVSCFACVAVNGDIIEYGDFFGPNIDYLDVTESATVVGPLFGEPELIGDMLNFNPKNYQSESKDGEIDFLDGTLTFTIESNSSFNGINISEFGSYFVSGDTSLAQAVLIATVKTEDGLFDGTFEFLQEGDGFGAWNGKLEINFPSTLTANVTINNILHTEAWEGGIGFIGKKGLKITVIPEPATAGILALAGIGILSRRRR